MRYLKNVVTLNLDKTKCTGCGRCTEVCPRTVLTLSNGKVETIDRDACIECGACSRNCPFEALTVSAGVGCAYAVIRGALKGTAPDCACSGKSDCC
ncbi:MAG: mercury methylation ferredoxin HgcB [Proteobacteria bacterium]|nr:mercury methylation ferredoxin HgcB [Pseudomonadota bacterium]